MPNQKGLIHILVVLILLVGLGATLYLSQKTQIFKPKAFEQTQSDQITKLTDDLLEAKDDREPNPDEMVRLAQERKDKLLVEAKNNPQAFLDHATLKAERDSFPIEVQNLIEEEETVQGELMVLHRDDFINHTSTTSYVLDMDNEDYSLHFVSSPPNLLSGSKVSASGIALDQNIVLQGNPITLTAVSAPAFGEQKLAVFLVNTDPNQSYTVLPDQVRNAFFSSPKSLDRFYRENSFDKISFSGQVFGWYNIPFNSTCTKENLDAFAKTVDDQARQEGVDLDSWPHRAYMYNGVGCGGRATFGGNPSRVWVNTLMVRGEDISWEIVHEIGHNLGLGHAGFLGCNRPIDLYGNCYTTEYFDDGAMGNSLAHFNAPHKVALNWIQSQNIKTITQSGIYTISPPIELPASVNETQVLKLLKQDTYENYYISYRQPIGFDSSPEAFVDPHAMTTGASIHIWDENPTNTTRLLRMKLGYFITPTNFVPSNYALEDNSSFIDERNGITIKQTSHNLKSVTLEITYNPPPAGFTNLSADISSTQATFRFNYSGGSGPPFSVDISDNPRFENGTLLNAHNFTIGNSSPIVARLNNPELCGVRLYWRISNRDRSVQSSVQSTIVNCGGISTPAPVMRCITDSDCPSGKVCQVPVCAPIDLEQACSEAVDKVACEKKIEEKEKTRCMGKCIRSY